MNFRLNNQATSGGDAAIVRRFSHGMVYGSVPKCPKCKEGNLHYDDGIFFFFI